MNYRDTTLIVLFLVAWVVLNRWVLPWCGVSTCMSGGCGTSCCSTAQENPSPEGVKGERPILEGDAVQGDERHDGLSQGH